MTRGFNLAVLVLILFVGVPFGWLLLDTSSSGAVAKPITMATLRQLGSSVPGEAPAEVRYELIARRQIIGDLLAAGSGLRPVPFGIRAYEIVYNDGRVVTVDRGMSRKLAQQQRLSDFDPEAQAIVEQATARTSVALTLANGPQHSGLKQVPSGLGSGRSGSAVKSAMMPYAVAPGVVVLPADDVSPGTRMVYVHLNSGRELILAGDVAPLRSSWQELRPPARLRTYFVTSDDRVALASWLLTLQDLTLAARKLDIVAGHDSAVPRILVHGFTADPRISRFARDKRLALQAMMR